MGGGASNAPRWVLVGPPGCGKGTQAALASEALGIPAISTGDMLRAAVESDSALGRRVASVVSAGRLVDDDTMAEVVRDRLRQPDAVGGFLLDGYPRTLAQAATLEAILAESGTALDGALYFEVPEDELVRRLLARGRADDREDVIRRRIGVYREKTEPLLAHYRERGLLRSIAGDRSIEEVAAGVLEAVAAEVPERWC